METFEKRSVRIRSSKKGKINSIKNEVRRRSKIYYLSDYFFVISFIFAVFLVVWSNRLHHHSDGLSPNHAEMMRMKASFLSSKSQRSRKITTNEHDHRLAGLQCDQWGGPSFEAAQEMVYWEDIPSDEKYLSPFHPKPTNGSSTELRIDQFVTFEPDGGGWNNIRMSMETLLAIAFAMGRTLVLPPHQKMYLLEKRDKNQRNEFSFEHFFHMERISQEHTGFNIISMDEFLELFLDGRFKDPETGKPIFPPNNRTDWNGVNGPEKNILKDWLRKSSKVLQWLPDDCMAAFPRNNSVEAMEELEDLEEEIFKEGIPNYEDYVGNPVPVNSTAKERLKENMAGRSKLCFYDTELQKEPWVHFPCSHQGEYKARMLVHFYAFLFFADWRADLWTKRFVRDHVRYVDEIQCSAARVVHAIRTNHDAEFDTIHVRRGDFQYKNTRVSIDKIFAAISKHIHDGSTLYIATDERDKNFFAPLKKHYKLLYLDDFKKELGDINTNYYGMIDQLIASRGRTFYGCWFSTFTGYINRLRGYHADDHQTHGYEEGIIPSYYYVLLDRYDHMREFWPVKRAFYAREFPTSWRMIDTGVEEDIARPET